MILYANQSYTNYASYLIQFWKKNNYYLTTDSSLSKQLLLIVSFIYILLYQNFFGCVIFLLSMHFVDTHFSTGLSVPLWKTDSLGNEFDLRLEGQNLILAVNKCLGISKPTKDLSVSMKCFETGLALAAPRLRRRSGTNLQIASRSLRGDLPCPRTLVPLVCECSYNGDGQSLLCSLRFVIDVH